MSWWDLIKDFVPPLREAIDNLRTSKRNRRHFFILKAIAPPNEHPDYISRHWVTVQEASERIKIAQIEDACGRETLAKAFLTGQGSKEEDKAAKKSFFRQRRLGLPDVGDPNRDRKVEKLLQEMVDVEKLTFYPPNRYAIKT